MNVALDVHVMEMSGFDPKQARHVYDLATVYENEEDSDGHLLLLVSDDAGKMAEVPAAECLVHAEPYQATDSDDPEGHQTWIFHCVYPGCMSMASPYALVKTAKTVPA